MQVVILADPDGHEVRPEWPCRGGRPTRFVEAWRGTPARVSTAAPNLAHQLCLAGWLTPLRCCHAPFPPQICFVGDEAFRQLSVPDDNAPTLLQRSISLDGSREWLESKQRQEGTVSPKAAAAGAAGAVAKAAAVSAPAAAAPPAAAPAVAAAASAKPAGK